MYIEIIDNFLNENELSKIDNELNNITWPKLFQRAGSHMYENTDMENLPVMREMYNKFSTPTFLKQLEDKIGIKGIVPDPHLIGAGYSEIKNHGDLKPHIDFNWNDTIKMYRVASLIIYLSEDYEGGELWFEDRDPVETKRNRAVIFSHSETIRHQVMPVKGIRRNLRFFYFASKLNPPEGYHRSLYGFKGGKAIDVKD